MEQLIVRLVKENLGWGYYRIEGDLKKLGFDVSLTTVCNVLSRKGTLMGSQFGHPLDLLKGLRLGLGNLLAQPYDENHQIMMKQIDKKKENSR